MLTVEVNGEDILASAVVVGQDVVELISDRVQVRGMNFAVVPVSMTYEARDVILT